MLVRSAQEHTLIRLFATLAAIRTTVPLLLHDYRDRTLVPANSAANIGYV